MQFRFRHSAFQPEHQPIVEAGWVIGAVLVQDQRSGYRAQRQEAVGIRGVGRQTRHLQAHDDPGFSEGHLAHEFLKAVAMLGARTGLAQIVIDDMNAFLRPAVSHGTLAQGVLAERALRVLDDLAWRGLANVEVGIPFEMHTGDLYVRHGGASWRGLRIKLAISFTSNEAAVACSTGVRTEANGT